jgi:hypothetical protein
MSASDPTSDIGQPLNDLCLNSHPAAFQLCYFEPERCLVLSLGGGNETARVHHACWKRCGLVAIRSARPADQKSSADRYAAAWFAIQPL